MRFESEKTKYRFVIILGIIISLAGLLLIAVYTLKAVIERAGEPDQSLIFWYIPFLLIGVITLIMGVSFSIWGMSSIRKSRISGDQKSEAGQNS
jgi:hypothetical protein